MNIEINETLWSNELSRVNAQRELESTNAAIFAKRRNEPAPTPLAPLTLPDLVAQVITEKETAILASQKQEHLTVIQTAAPDDLARMAKILGQDDTTKDAIRSQVDALK